MQKRFISLFLATAAVLAACCGVFYAQSRQTAPVSYSYSQTDFEFSINLAKDSLGLCAIADNTEIISSRLLSYGFDDIDFFQYENGLKSDNKAGLLLAHRQNTLLAVIRGTKDEEWYSNFHIGEGMEHAGFSKAAEIVTENIGNYLHQHNIQAEETEVFLTGHSRGAAVANITAARLIDENRFKAVIAYTFACPNTTMLENAQDSRYKSIVNIINPQDFICYIPLPQWGYTRYGQTVELPTEATEKSFQSLYSEMEKAYLARTCTELRDFPDKSRDVESIIAYLELLAPSPRDYYEKEITVGGFRLTMYDYMMKLAAVMNHENPLLHGLFMLSCKSVPEVCPITEFVFSGLTQQELKIATSLESTPVVANHMPDAYLAWLGTLEESYFTERLVP